MTYLHPNEWLVCEGEPSVVRLQEDWWTYVVYPNPTEMAADGFSLKFGWWIPQIEETPPETPPKPKETIGEIWGRERWGA